MAVVDGVNAARHRRDLNMGAPTRLMSRLLAKGDYDLPRLVARIFPMEKIRGWPIIGEGADGATRQTDVKWTMEKVLALGREEVIDL